MDAGSGAVADEEAEACEAELKEIEDAELLTEIEEKAEQLEAAAHTCPPQTCRSADSHAPRTRSSSGSNSSATSKQMKLVRK